MPIRIFVSYSHDDDRWFKARSRYDFIPWLQKSLQKDQVELWYDRGLEVGEESCGESRRRSTGQMRRCCW